jgi:hypothetical protein
MAKAPSFLQSDPEERIIRWGWVAWLGWFAVGGSLLLYDMNAGRGGFSAVLTAPFWVIWFLWPVYRVLRVLWSWQQQASWGPWQGQYYEFDGRQIRILFDGDDIWFVANDVFDALGISGHQRNPERVRQIAGRDGLAAAPGSRRLAFSERGLAAWLERRADLNAHKFGIWVTKQVIEPFRRRRELDEHRTDP